MIRLHYSNRFDALADALIENLNGPARPDHPLDPTTIIVPHFAVATWLKQAIARRSGIAANLDFIRLGHFLRDVLERGASTRRVLQGVRLEVAVLRALAQKDDDAEELLEPLTRYLSAAGEDPHARDVRRLQLAEQLAHQFGHYVLHRWDVLEAWRRSQSCFADNVDFARTERFERHLWNRCRAEAEARGSDPLPRAFERVALTDRAVPRVVHLFDVPLVAATHRNIIRQLGHRTEVFVYAFNPCVEFWEDVVAGFEAKGLRARLVTDENAQLELQPQRENPALQNWGRPGRERIRILNELSEFDFQGRFVHPTEPASTVLAQLQHDILVREPSREWPDPSFDFANDDSVQVFGCPGIRREAETIAKEIRRLLRTAPEGQMRFNDVVVALPDRAQHRYRAAIAAAFHEYGEIPHHQLSVPLKDASRALEVVQLLLQLPFGRFRREDVLRIATHPLVASRLGVTAKRDWVRWCEDLVILHGRDHRDHEDTYIEKDLYHWDQGLQRLALGALMSDGASLEHPPFRTGEGELLPFAIDPSQRQEIAAFISLVRSLIADSRFAASSRMSLPKWMQFIRALVVSYVAAVNERDESHLARIEDAIENLEAEIDDPAETSFAVAAALVQSTLGRITTNVGTPFGGGVCVGPMSVVHTLPFPIAFVVGLGESEFPATDAKNQLDLRAAQRRKGDVSPRERDLYLFLSRVVNTTQTLRLSFVSRDAQSGEQLAPSVVVDDLLEILRGNYAVGRKTILRSIPLRPHEETDDPDTPESIRRQRHARRLREELAEHLGSAPSHLTHLSSALSSEARQVVAETLALANDSVWEPGAHPEVDEVQLYAIASYLRNPRLGVERHLFRTRASTRENLLMRSDERFVSERIDARPLLTRVMLEHVACPDAAEDLAARHARHADREELLGRAPTGVFGRQERRVHLEILSAWAQELQNHFRAGEARLCFARIGRAGDARFGDRIELPPIAIEASSGAGFELHGVTAQLSQPPLRWLRLDLRGRPSKRDCQAIEIDAFVDYVAMVASGHGVQDVFSGKVIFADRQTHTFGFAGLESESARQWLGEVCAALTRPDADRPSIGFPGALRLAGPVQGGLARPELVARILRYHPAYPLGPKPPEELDPEQLIRLFSPYFAHRLEGG